MKIASVAEVKSQFSAFLKSSEAGPVVVTKNGRPVAVIVGVQDEDEVERLLMAYSPRLQKILQTSRKQIREGKTLSHDEFWTEVESARASLFHPRVAGEELVVAHDGEGFAVEPDQRSGNAHLASAGLAGAAAPGDANGQIDGVALAGSDQRIEHGAAVFFVREVFLERAAVDENLTLAGLETDAGHRGLAAAGPQRFVRYLVDLRSEHYFTPNSFGCGC
jgi:prevent-host-death family protein